MKPQFMSQVSFPRSTPRALLHVTGDCYTPTVTWRLRPVFVVPRPGVASKPASLREIWQRRQATR